MVHFRRIVSQCLTADETRMKENKQQNCDIVEAIGKRVQSEVTGVRQVWYMQFGVKHLHCQINVPVVCRALSSRLGMGRIMAHLFDCKPLVGAQNPMTTRTASSP